MALIVRPADTPSLAAQSIGIFTSDVPDPLAPTQDERRRPVTLGADISFQYPIQYNIQTLSSKDVEHGDDPFGLLFVPALQSDACKKAEAAFVPANATRIQNIPRNGDSYALIGFAPWFSPPCMLEYFQSVRKSDVKAVIVYQPGNSTDMPPIMNDASWGLGDGGTWKVDNDFPTYAIMAASGGIIMEELSLYSGNITDVPQSDDLLDIGLEPTDYVRLYATVATDSGTQLPSLWVFLVIVLGILILIILATSGFMHFIQRRRRNDLRRRVINGEVNLEALGVKRLTVPREFLEKLPLYTYSVLPAGSDHEKTVPQPPAQAHNLPSPTIEAETGVKTLPLTRRSSAPIATAPPTDTSPAFSQPTCPICLEDFESNETQVRELPCRHIFHPDCIDTFLISNSSLCPMCKESVLPGGYCPAKITNVMVRRERLIRRMQSRGTTHAASEPASSRSPSSLPRPLGSLGHRIGGAIAGRRVFSAPERRRSQPLDIEMGTSQAGTRSEPSAALPHHQAEASPAGSQIQDGAGCSEPTTQNRREWARERALALLGNNHIPTESDEEDRGPRWKRGIRKIFPGFR
ncbi:hypothetical protein K491DRAFT_700193 [Lophiostoma macrostomum CBS 122681]|uniref:RING-type domain-containing protein n=1 Tax=Lophiostoma macrostomum CBS 122681 TaxID=1314788 RepID=A0A6A6TQM5_9PLEO|nr:hypothetical protein K491DRAFT_700193 [Lophiostoma macrostomum CBS 122681]